MRTSSSVKKPNVTPAISTTVTSLLTAALILQAAATYMPLSSAHMQGRLRMCVSESRSALVCRRSEMQEEEDAVWGRT